MVDPFFVYCKQHGPNQPPSLNPWARWVIGKPSYNLPQKQLKDPPFSSDSTAFDPRRVFASAFGAWTNEANQQIHQQQHDMVRDRAEEHYITSHFPKLETDIVQAQQELQKTSAKLSEESAQLDELRSNTRNIFHKWFETQKDTDTPQADIFDIFMNHSDTMSVKPTAKRILLEAYNQFSSSDSCQGQATPSKRRGESEPLGPTPGTIIRKNQRPSQHTRPCSICKALVAPPEAKSEDLYEFQDSPVLSSSKRMAQDTRSNFVNCHQCQITFHWACLEPPLTRGFPRGYIWR
jgi:hypothetical protein